MYYDSHGRSVVYGVDPARPGSGEIEIPMFCCAHCGCHYPLGRHVGTDGKVHEGEEGSICKRHMRYVCKSGRCQRDCQDYLDNLLQGRN